jgi:hypothetical protein
MKYVVHMGATKTGSSFLQERVFPRVEGLNFLGKENNQQYPRWLIDWIYMDDLAFEENIATIRQHVESESDPDKVNVISAEAFFSGGRFKQSVDRILKVLPEARILYVLRDPISWLKSRYAYGVEREGLYLPFEQAIDFGRSPLIFYKQPPIYLPDLFYTEQIEYLKALIKNDDFKILLFEELKSEPKQFLEKLANFLGLKFSDDILSHSAQEKVNAVTKGLNVNAQRWENLRAKTHEAFGVSIDNKPEMHDEPFMSEAMEGRLRDYFRGNCHTYKV